MSSFDSASLPTDIVPLLVEHLDERRDLYAAALVNRTFNYAATRNLYRSIHPRCVQHHHLHDRLRMIHPAQTVLTKPNLAHHVLRIHENGDKYGASTQDGSAVLSQALACLVLCKNVHTFVLTGSAPIREDIFLSFLTALRGHPYLRSLTIRTPGAISEPVWTELQDFIDLTHVSIWCMEGPPRFLQGWSPALAPTLTHLEIGRAAGVPATLLISSLSTLNHLESLRIRGMQSAAVPMLLSRLPSLRVFDTDYNSGGLSRWQPMLPAPRLRELTIRASSLDSNDSPKLWEWITRLIPASAYTDIVDQRDPTVRGTCDLDEISIVSHAQPQAGPGYGLESFTLYAGSVIFSPLFTTYLNAYHRFSLRKLLMGSTEVTNLSQFCHSFGAIEELECSVSITNACEIVEAFAKLPNLRAAWLEVHWLTPSSVQTMEEDAEPGAPIASRDAKVGGRALRSPSPPILDTEVEVGEGSATVSEGPFAMSFTTLSARDKKRMTPNGWFDLQDARRMMLGVDSTSATPSKLRQIAVGSAVYAGRWVRNPATDQSEFEVYRKVDGRDS